MRKLLLILALCLIGCGVVAPPYTEENIPPVQWDSQCNYVEWWMNGQHGLSPRITPADDVDPLESGIQMNVTARFLSAPRDGKVLIYANDAIWEMWRQDTYTWKAQLTIWENGEYVMRTFSPSGCPSTEDIIWVEGL